MRVGLWRKLSTKNWCFWTVVLEKTLESSLDCKEIQPVHPKGNQSCIFIGRTDAKAEIPILRPPDAKNWLIGKDPDAGKDWRWEEKGMIDDDMVRQLSLTQWTWIWVNSRNWWWTGTPGLLQSMELQRVRHNWETEWNWTEHLCTVWSFLKITVKIYCTLLLQFSKQFNYIISFDLEHIDCLGNTIFLNCRYIN